MEAEDLILAWGSLLKPDSCLLINVVFSKTADGWEPEMGQKLDHENIKGDSHLV